MLQCSGPRGAGNQQNPAKAGKRQADPSQIHKASHYNERVETLALARMAAVAAADKKAEDVVLMDLRQLSGIADYFVIATGGVGRQVDAIANSIREEVRKHDDTRQVRTEGNANSGWMLLDYGDLIVHLFTPSRRSYYNLEGLWVQAPVLLRME